MAPLSLPAWLPPLPGQPWTPLAPAVPASLRSPRPLPTPPAQPKTPQQRARLSQTRPRDQMIEASLSDRWYILGQTGSGKTRFAKQLVRELLTLFPGTSLYILDSKGDEFPGWPGLVPSQEPPPPLSGSGRVQVWQPPDEDDADYDTWLDGIKSAPGAALLLVDELSSMGRNSYNSYPAAFARILKQGRSLKKCVVTLTQEAAQIPRQVPKQTTHIVAFSLSPDDEHAITQLCKLFSWPIPRKGESAPAPSGTYGFFYRRRQPKPGPVEEYENYQEFFG